MHRFSDAIGLVFTRKSFDTLCIMRKIFHICIIIQTALKARLVRPRGGGGQALGFLSILAGAQLGNSLRFCYAEW